MKSALDETRGHHVLNYTVCPEAAAIVVTGVPFSGTPVIASTLQFLGLPFGESSEAILFGDDQAEITSPILIGDRWLQLCRAGATEPGKWGIAAPRLLQYADAFLCYAQSVRFVVVVRDVLASSSDACLSGAGAQPRLAVEHAVELAFSLQRLQLLPVPVLLLSYERCLRDPESALSLLELFCGLAPSDNARGSALSFMAGYEARHHTIAKISYRGRVDKVVDDKLLGWAEAEGGGGRSLKVALYLDGQKIAVSDASVLRQDLAAAGIGDGYHGFEFELPRGTSPGAIVSVRIAHTLQILENSGLPLRDY